MQIDVNVLNLFLKASVDTCKVTTGVSLSIGKPYSKALGFDNSRVLIMLGVTGEITGQVIFEMDRSVAIRMATAMMMGYPVTELDDMSISAISELGNMIMGSAATLLSSEGIAIDITPPIVQAGMNCIGSTPPANICVPLNGEDGFCMEINFRLSPKEKQ